MVSIRFKLLWVVLAFVGAYLFVNDAFAYTVSRDPAGFSVTSPIDYTFSLSKQDYYDEGGAPGSLDSGNFICFTAQNYSLENLPGNDFLDTYLAYTGAFPFDGGAPDNQQQIYNFSLSLNPGDEVETVDYNIMTGNEGCDPVLLVNGPTTGIAGSAVDYTGSILFQISNITSSNTTWNNDDAFWGDEFSTAQVKETLTASVQDTSTDLWGLLIFSGIALAFIIFLQVVFLTKKSIKPTSKKTFDPIAFNKKADELDEFYNRTGGADPELVDQIKKRGRGRPRKNPII